MLIVISKCLYFDVSTSEKADYFKIYCEHGAFALSVFIMNCSDSYQCFDVHVNAFRWSFQFAFGRTRTGPKLFSAITPQIYNMCCVPHRPGGTDPRPVPSR